MFVAGRYSTGEEKYWIVEMEVVVDDDIADDVDVVEVKEEWIRV